MAAAKPTAFGPRLMSLVAQLGLYILPLRRMHRVFEQCLGIRVSPGQVSACVTVAAQALAEPHEQIG